MPCVCSVAAGRVQRSEVVYSRSLRTTPAAAAIRCDVAGVVSLHRTIPDTAAEMSLLAPRGGPRGSLWLVRAAID